MVNSVLNEGVRGMMNSQREMHKAAHDIARANVNASTDEADQAAQAITATEQPTTLPPVNEATEGRQRGIEESLIELRRQEHLFTANAAVVKVADDTLGSIIDVKS